MTRAAVDPGICGFEVTITACTQDLRRVRLVIDTDCPALQHAAAALQEVDAHAEMEPDAPGAQILRACALNLYCGGCPVPAALVKAVEVEAGLAQPRDASIRLEHDPAC